MCKSMSIFIKCLGAGIIIGAAAGAFCLCKVKETKKEKGIKRKAKEAMGAMEDMMEDIHNMFLKKGC